MGGGLFFGGKICVGSPGGGTLLDLLLLRERCQQEREQPRIHEACTMQSGDQTIDDVEERTSFRDVIGELGKMSPDESTEIALREHSSQQAGEFTGGGQGGVEANP